MKPSLLHRAIAVIVSMPTASSLIDDPLAYTGYVCMQHAACIHASNPLACNRIRVLECLRSCPINSPGCFLFVRIFPVLFFRTGQGFFFFFSFPRAAPRGDQQTCSRGEEGGRGSGQEVNPPCFFWIIVRGVCSYTRREGETLRKRMQQASSQSPTLSGGERERE